MLNNLWFEMVCPRASDTDIPGFFWYAERNLFIWCSGSLLCFLAFFWFVRGRGLYGDSEILTVSSPHIFSARKACPPHRAVGIAERDLECHHHLDDLLPSPPDASTHAGGAPRAVQHVHKHCHDAHRVCGTLHHPWNWSGHRSSPEWTTPRCVLLCLERVLS